MADTKISALSAASSLSSADILPVVQGGTTKKATVAQMRAGMVPSGGVASLTAVALAPQFVAPTTGSSTQIADNTGSVILAPAGTLAAATLVMPANPVDGQELIISCSQIITTLTMSPSGAETILGALTAFTANGFGRWRYRATGTTWYRVG